MTRQVIFILLICLVVQSCSSNNSVNISRKISSELKKDYNLSRSDLIVAYDLGRIDNTNCIYSQDLVLVINNSEYSRKYLKKFKRNFRSTDILRSEALKKIRKIYSLLIKLHSKYRILSDTDYKYVKKLSRSDIAKIDPKKELDHLDVITSSIPLLLPNYNGTVTSSYGYRKHPISKKREFHCGLDIISDMSSPIYASASGKVTFVGRKNGYGRLIEINHGNNIKSLYAHLSSTKVKVGQKILRGVSIGRQGNSGATKGEHLHFEVKINNQHVDPRDFVGHACGCK